jgi:hypothetical protein
MTEKTKKRQVSIHHLEARRKRQHTLRGDV